MRKVLCLMVLSMLLFTLIGCKSSKVVEKEEPSNIPADSLEDSSKIPPEKNLDTKEDSIVPKMNIEIKNKNFTVTLEDNSSVDFLVEMLQKESIVIQMIDYGGFEKVGQFETSLPTNDEQIHTDIGDIILYQGNRFVIYYASNSWSFTKLGKIEDTTGLKDALGTGDVTVTLSLL